MLYTMSDKFKALTDEFMPDFGEADTVIGEVVRAANKIIYDCYNNGFCNNTSGALNYLERWAADNGYSVTFEDKVEFVLGSKVNSGGLSYYNEVDVACAFNDLTEIIVHWHSTQPALALAANSVDMYTYQDADYEEDEEDEDDYWADQYEEEDEYEDELH